MKLFDVAVFFLGLAGSTAFLVPTAPAETLRIAGSYEYPRVIAVDGGTTTVHHPQIETWEDFETMSGWVVIEVRKTGDENSWLGSFLVEGETDIDFDERLVVIHDITVKDQKFPSGEPPAEILALAHQAISGKARSVPLDVFIRILPEDFELPEKGMAPPLSAEPPTIYASIDPAELMIINGDPVLVPIDDTKLQFVVNTNWDLFYDTGKKRWYVLNNFAWQYSKSLDTPAWKTTTRLPGDFKELPDGNNWSRVKQYLPAEKPDEELPRIIVSQRPAELILLDGEPQLERIPGTDIAFVKNTVSDLFVFASKYYFLVSGRWFVAPQLAGPYTAVQKLPEAFASIPADHKRGHVLVSVPGTAEARAAIIEALIPRQAVINKTAGAKLQVTYAGDPQFVDIKGTSLKRAVNTQSQVIQVGSGYYLCSNGVWFVGASPEGSWQVAEQIPAEIYSIPPSDPAHNTTYVYIVDDDDDDTVKYAYTSGYYGSYVTVNSVTFGTGYYYNPWVYYPAYGYPYYYYYPASYGYAAYYNPATGYYGRGAVAYGPYGGAGSTAVYNPQTGAYGRGWAAWDSDEVARAGYAYNPRTNTYVAGNSYYDYADQEGWRQGYVQRNDNWVYGETTVDGNQLNREIESSGGATASRQRTVGEDSVTGSAELQGSERSASATRQVNESGAELAVTGDQGGSANFSRVSGQSGVEVSGTTSEGTNFAGNAERTDGGARATLESEAGGSAMIRRNGTEVSGAGKSASGEYYAGRDGNVFRRSEDAWQKYNGGNWESVGTVDRGSLDRQRNGRRSGGRNFDRFRGQRRLESLGGRSSKRRR